MSRQLTATQLEILKTLIELYEKKKRMIKSREVAEYLNKDEGTVRNIIMWLRGMGLVDSRTGPSGGYVPTIKAYQLLSGELPVFTAGYGEAFVDTVEGTVKLVVQRLEIMNLLSGHNVKALLQVGGSITKIQKGNTIKVIGYPRGRIFISGKVNQVNPVAGEILVDVQKMVVIPDEIVGKIASRRLIKIKENMTIRHVAKTLYKYGIRGAPVVDNKNKVVGFITMTDIARVIGEGGGLEDPVSKYMKRHVFTIRENESIVEAMRLMDYHSVGRLLVVDNKGDPVGIITRTDILRFIVGLGEGL
ncbi:MAG: CBS domain-containing protein [Desulfurococcales archaeon]|nr:CBS domain-containing protein [Desulfurococcales archaeon]